MLNWCIGAKRSKKEKRKVLVSIFLVGRADPNQAAPFSPVNHRTSQVILLGALVFPLVMVIIRESQLKWMMMEAEEEEAALLQLYTQSLFQIHDSDEP